MFVFLLFCGCACKDKIAEITDVKETDIENVFECTYGGKPRRFSIYLPETAEGELPLILMLNGYGSTPEAFRAVTHMDDDGCARGYAVAYAGTAAAGWNNGMDDDPEIDDVGWLRALAAYLQKEYSCSKDRTSAVGFSNGAFMAQRLAVEAQDTFCAVCSVAGSITRPVWEKRGDTADIGVMILYGTGDELIPSRKKAAADSSIYPAVEDVVEYWTGANDLTEKNEETLSERAVLTRYTSKDASKEVCLVEIDKYAHSWPEARFCGFETNTVILDFLDRCR